MARRKTSSVEFNFNIKNIKDAERLKQILPAIISDFDKLSKSIDKVNKSQDKSSGSSLTKSKVSDRITGLKLGVKKGDITNVRQLTANYASLISQVRRLEKQGQSTNAVELRALKTYRSLREELEKRAVAQKKSESSIESSIGAEQRLTKNVQNTYNAIASSGQRMKQGASSAVDASQTYKQAGYVFLNTGYLIQDSPYGIRGVANNISQSVQAFQMLGNSVEKYNKQARAAGQETMTVFSAMKSSLMGPTGIVLLVGSVLPAALEVWNTKGDDIINWFKELRGIIPKAKVDLEKFATILEKITEEKLSFSGFNLGEDPLGIEDMYSDLFVLHDAEKAIEDVIKPEMEKLQKIAEEKFGTTLEQLGVTTISEFTKNTFNTLSNLLGYEVEGFTEQKKYIDSLIEYYGISLEKGESYSDAFKRINQEIRNTQKTIQRTNEEIENDSFLSFLYDRTTETKEIVENINLFSSEIFKNSDIVKKYISDAESLMKKYEESAKKLLLNPTEENIAKLKVLSKSYEDLFSLIEDSAEESEESVNYKLKQEIFLAERALENSKTYYDRIVELNTIYKLKKKELDEKEFEDEEERKLEEIKLEAEKEDAIFEVVKSNKERISQLKQLGIESSMNEGSFNNRINAIEKYYNERRRFLKDYYEDEKQLEIELRELSIKEAKEKEAIKKQYYNNIREIAGNSLESIFNIAGVIANKQDKNDRARFAVQKVASASRAAISTGEAVMKALAQGGPLAIPAATSMALAGATQIAYILSQSYDNVRKPSGRDGGLNYSYRGFDIGNYFRDNNGNSVFYGNQPDYNEGQTIAGNVSMPSKVKAVFEDGFGEVVSRGTIQLQKENKQDLGLWD